MFPQCERLVDWCCRRAAAISRREGAAAGAGAGAGAVRGRSSLHPGGRYPALHRQAVSVDCQDLLATCSSNSNRGSLRGSLRGSRDSMEMGASAC